jgi:hypothetical protein
MTWGCISARPWAKVSATNDFVAYRRALRGAGLEAGAYTLPLFSST